MRPDQTADYDLDYEYIHTMRGWRDIEETQNSGYDIVDFDLVTENGKRKLSTRVEVLECLNSIRSAIESSSESDSTFLSKVTASETFNRYLLGEKIPFKKYISKTLGFEPRQIPKRIVEEYGDSAQNLLSRLGFTYSKDAFAEYLNAFKVQDAREVEKFLNSSGTFWVDKIRQVIQYEGPLYYSVSYTQKDEPWCVGLWGDVESGVQVLINTHERHQFTRGQCKYLPSHEIAGHAVQLSCRQEQIRLASLRPALGIVSTFNPDIALSEGLAQALPYFLVDEGCLDIEFLSTKRIREHRDIVLHNAHLFLEEGTELRDAIVYCLENLPFMREDEARKELSERLKNPLLKTYMFCYAPAFLAFRAVARNLSEENRNDFLKKHYYSVPNAEDVWNTWLPF